MTALYRLRQFLLAVAAWTRPETDAELVARRVLPPGALKLYQHMPSYDRHHVLRVARTLERRGHTEPDLLAAALLHDVGKTASPAGRLRLWHRVAVVLLSMWPGLLGRVGEDRPGSWRYPFYVQQHHATLGAEWARRAGCSPATVELILRHEDPPGSAQDAALAALLSADDAN
jgi:putative nucleotidyltransferase with HDIG domain